MLTTWMIAAVSLLSGPEVVCQPSAAPGTLTAPSADLETLYHQGKIYKDFRDAATRRVEAWNDHYARAQVPDALRTRLTAVPGTWRLLVVAEDWCGDSANTIPYVAKLADVAGNLDLRIINSDIGRAIMEAHRTPDGRAATPTVILLTEDFEEAGCFVERPRQLQNWFLEQEHTLDREELLRQKYAWYDEDKGRETVAEIVELIESAAAGTQRCGG